MSRTIGRVLASVALTALGALLLTAPATATAVHTKAWVGNPVKSGPTTGPDGIEWPDD